MILSFVSFFPKKFQFMHYQQRILCHQIHYHKNRTSIFGKSIYTLSYKNIWVPCCAIVFRPVSIRLNFKLTNENFVIDIWTLKNFPPMEMPGIEPGAFHMQSERATTALHPLTQYFYCNRCLWIIFTISSHVFVNKTDNKSNRNWLQML